MAQSRKDTRKQSGRSSGKASRAQSARAKKKRSASAQRQAASAKAGKKSGKAKRSTAKPAAKAAKPRSKPRPKTTDGKAAAGTRGKRERAQSQPRAVEEPVPATEVPRGRRFEPAELVGESEYSARAARGRPRRGAGLVTEGRLPEDPAEPTPETLGRHFLEEVTEAPAPDPEPESEEPESESAQADVESQIY